MCGGRSDRCSQLWNHGRNKWTLSPKLPLEHNLTSFVAVNYRNSAVYTFCQDAEMTICSAHLDLVRARWTAPTTENQAEMPWTLKLPMEQHGVSNLLLR
mmetsp:Transcript_17137/g.23095  ORF Transcript_17137/g.23095 Transcript_17137/m.23095 type:complete len:99 (-) Transcript_17137:356-652(-)